MKSNNIIFILIGYFLPVVGWMIPLYLKENSDDCQFHAKQSFVIGRFFLFLLGILWVLGNFIPLYLDYLFTIFAVILLLAYYSLLIFGGLLAYFGNKSLPYFGKQVERVNL